MSMTEDMLRRMVAAANGEVSLNPFSSLEPADWPDDPVSRLTEEPDDPDRLPLQTEPFQVDGPSLDAMTTTRKERRLAQETFAQSTPGSSAAFRAADAATGMTTGDLALKALSFEGAEYEWGGTSRGTGLDCSGLIWRIMTNNGFKNYPRHSSAIYAHAKKISLKKAINTKGAILYRPGHIAISLGNGKTIEAKGEDYGVVVDTAEGRFTAGGLLPELQMGKPSAMQRRVKRNGGERLRIAKAAVNPLNKLEGASATNNAPMVFGKVMDEFSAPQTRGVDSPDIKAPKKLKGVKGQIYAGFMEAGRPDLAKMVFTEDFDIWLGQESSWEVGNVSRPYDGIRNYGLFQFRNLAGRDWLTQYIKRGKFTASAYQQAILAATYFDLNPEDIRRYANEISNDTYQGWG